MSRPFPGAHRRRKTNSLDGIVAGIEYNRYRSGINHAPLDRQSAIDSQHPQHEYQPDPGQPDSFQAAYEPYEWEAHSRQTPTLRLDPIPRPPSPHDPPPIYDDGRLTQAAFEHSMQQPSSPAFTIIPANGSPSVGSHNTGIRTRTRRLRRRSCMAAFLAAGQSGGSIQPRRP